MSKKEKRRFQRFPFDARATIQGKLSTWETHLLDICFKGVLVNAPDDFPVKMDERFQIEIIFTNSEPLIKADVSLAHSEPGRIGFRVVQIDLDSMSHLRRLVELNLGNSDLLEREFHQLVESYRTSS